MFTHEQHKCLFAIYIPTKTILSDSRADVEQIHLHETDLLAWQPHSTLIPSIFLYNARPVVNNTETGTVDDK